MPQTPKTDPAPLPPALPFWLSLGLVPLMVLAARFGGAWLALVPLYAWGLTAVLDRALGAPGPDPDPNLPEARLRWHRALVLIWFPVQLAMLIWLLAGLGGRDLPWGETIALFFGMGVMSGSIGIVYAHELLHQGSRLERWLGDLLLAMVLYAHFRSEHLLVHHRHVGTPRDAVSARYNEGFHRYFARVLRRCPGSAWRAERALLARRGLGMASLRNPFWRFGLLQAGFLALAYGLGGWAGLGLFLWQAFVAIWQLELTNYVEHYGLVRKYLGQGRYEPVRPHHSWNAAQQASNWLLINLQRHSDHHIRPDRRFPLLQNHPADQAPQLPLGYPLMAALAMVPPAWRRVMNPKVRAWRRQFYPEITDWAPYSRGLTPPEPVPGPDPGLKSGP